MTAEQAKLKTLETRRALKIEVMEMVDVKMETIDKAIERGAFSCRRKGIIDKQEKQWLKENNYAVVENQEGGIIITLICWL